MATNQIVLSEDAAKAAADMEKTTLNILVIGKTGVGKSALINALVGYEVSRESEIEAGTCEVKKIPANLHGGITATFYDSPGLCDAKGNEKEYLQQIVDISDDLDLILYCTKLTNTRFTEEDCATICKFTQVLGEKFWENAVFVLTFANRLRPKSDRHDPEKKKKFMEDKVNLWSKKLQEALRKEAKVKSAIVKNIPVVPAGYHASDQQILPNGTHWFSSFWLACFMKVKNVSKPAVIQGCLDMFETESEKQQIPVYEPHSGTSAHYPMPQMSPTACTDPPPSYTDYESQSIGQNRRQIPMTISLPSNAPMYQIIMQLLSSYAGQFGVMGKLISLFMDLGTEVVKFLEGDDDD